MPDRPVLRISISVAGDRMPCIDSDQRTEGRPINEVADLLGHRIIDTTAIYVKVALPLLADVALPFPGGVR